MSGWLLATLSAPGWLLGRLMIAAVRGYQLLISPWLGPRCRFTPSCSVYFIESVRLHGPIRGGWRGAKRIARCHPWSEGGHDPP